VYDIVSVLYKCVYKMAGRNNCIMSYLNTGLTCRLRVYVTSIMIGQFIMRTTKNLFVKQVFSSHDNFSHAHD